jgi:ATP-dependent DNA helicase RecG
MEKKIRNILENGENSFVEFKEVAVSPQTLSEEIVAFLNVRGGYILVGVRDDGSVSGIDPARKKDLEETVMNICRTSIVPPIIPLYENVRIRKKWIVKISISEGFEKPYRTVQGKYLIRVGSTKRISSREELLRLFQNAMIYHIDDRPVIGSSREDVDLNKIGRYFNDVYEFSWDEMEPDEQEKLLLNSCILAPFESRVHATIAGLLFFAAGRTPFNSIERYLPHAGIQFVVYRDEDMETILDRLECFEPCPEAIDSVVQKIRLNWKTPSRIQGLQREETPFSVKVFRELIVNAVVHRDYSLQARIRIRMFPQRIEIISPGRLANTVTVEKMKAGISIARNPILLKFMQTYRYADQLGRGIPMIMRAVKKMSGFDLELKERDEEFWVVLRFPSLQS